MNMQHYTSEARLFTRRWWLGGAKTLFWVTLVTLLVWVYADMEHTDQEEFKAVLRLTMDSTNDMVLLFGDDGTTVPMVNFKLSFELRGNRKMLDRFKRQLSVKGGVLEYKISGDYTPGRHAIDAAEIVERAALLEQQGLALLSTSEPTVDVILDKLLTEMVKVNFVHTGPELVGQPVILPSEVPIRVTSGTWQQIVAAGGIPVLDTRSKDLAAEPTIDGAGTVQAALSAKIGQFHIVPTVSDVTVKYKTADVKMETKQVKVSVRVLAPPEWSEKGGVWTRLVLDRKDKIEWLPLITIRGPQKECQQLSDPPKVAGKIDAYIVLNDGEESDVGSSVSKKVTIRFPPGLRVQLVGNAPEVRLRFVERGAAPLGP